MNRSAKDGAGSSPHYGDEGAWVPLHRTKVCAGDTVGKNVSDSERPGIVRRQGMAGIVRHSQTNGLKRDSVAASSSAHPGMYSFRRVASLSSSTPANSLRCTIARLPFLPGL